MLEINRLEEENKKLKSDIEDMDKALMQYINAVSELQEKISNSKEELSKLKEKSVGIDRITDFIIPQLHWIFMLIIIVFLIVYSS